MIFTRSLQTAGCVTSRNMQLTAVNNIILFDLDYYYYYHYHYYYMQNGMSHLKFNACLLGLKQ